MKNKNAISRLGRLKEKGFRIQEADTGTGTAVIITQPSGLVTINGSMAVLRTIEGNVRTMIAAVPDEQMKEEVIWYLQNGLPYGRPGQISVLTADEIQKSGLAPETILLLPGVYPSDIIPYLRKPPELTVSLNNVIGIENDSLERLFSKPMKKTSKKQREQDFVNVNKALEKFPYGGQLAVRAVERELENDGFPDKVLEGIKKNSGGVDLTEYRKLLEDYCRLYKTLDYDGRLAGVSYYDRRYMAFYLIKEGLKRGSGDEKKSALLKKARALQDENAVKQKQLKASRFELPFHNLTKESEFLQNYPGEAERQEVKAALDIIRRDKEIGLLTDHRIKPERFSRVVIRILSDVLATRYEEFPYLSRVSNLNRFTDILFDYSEILKTEKAGEDNVE